MSQDRRNPATSAVEGGGGRGAERQRGRGRGLCMTHTLFFSHCHSTAVALDDFWPAVGSPSDISITPSGSSPLPRPLCLCVHSSVDAVLSFGELLLSLHVLMTLSRKLICECNPLTLVVAAVQPNKTELVIKNISRTSG